MSDESLEYIQLGILFLKEKRYSKTMCMNEMTSTDISGRPICDPQLQLVRQACLPDSPVVASTDWLTMFGRSAVAKCTEIQSAI